MKLLMLTTMMATTTTPALSLITMNLASVNDISEAYPDLTPEEQQVLLNIRKRKEELLQEIYQLKEELSDVNTEIQAMDTEEGAKMKTLQMGKKKFNMDPKKGVEYLISHDLIKETPEDVAAFLYKGEGLNKTMIGDYLGERNDFNEAVLKAFVELHDFTDLIVVKSFRTIFAFKVLSHSVDSSIMTVPQFLGLPYSFIIPTIYHELRTETIPFWHYVPIK